MIKISTSLILVIAAIFTFYGATTASIAWFGDVRVSYILGCVHIGLLVNIVIDKQLNYSWGHFCTDIISCLFCVYGVVVLVSGV